MSGTPQPGAVGCGILAAAVLVLLGGLLPAQAGTAQAAVAECAQPARTKRVPAELMDSLISWIGEATAYDTAILRTAPPEISFCSNGETIRYEGREVLVERDLKAAYDREAQRIFLVEPWSATDARDAATLLHELIHHIQYASRAWECPQAVEWEAYKLTEAWLGERGIDPGFDWLWIYVVSRCPRDIHP